MIQKSGDQIMHYHSHLRFVAGVTSVIQKFNSKQLFKGSRSGVASVRPPVMINEDHTVENDE